MCFGPSNAEIEASNQARREADLKAEEERRKKASAKSEDIDFALTGSSRSAGGGGLGRPSLLSSSSSGYKTRFD